MKYSIINISMLLILFLTIACEKEIEFSNFVEGYIIASFSCDKIDAKTGQASGELTKRGFLILLENQTDSISTFSLHDDLFDFSSEMIEFDYDINNCGPIFFVDKLKYKIRFKYEKAQESDKIFFACGPCSSMDGAFNWEAYQQVIINEVIKIN